MADRTISTSEVTQNITQALRCFQDIFSSDQATQFILQTGQGHLILLANASTRLGMLLADKQSPPQRLVSIKEILDPLQPTLRNLKARLLIQVEPSLIGSGSVERREGAQQLIDQLDSLATTVGIDLNMSQGSTPWMGKYGDSGFRER